MMSHPSVQARAPGPENTDLYYYAINRLSKAVKKQSNRPLSGLVKEKLLMLF